VPQPYPVTKPIPAIQAEKGEEVQAAVTCRPSPCGSCRGPRPRSA
jgi:hypothetical protein